MSEPTIAPNEDGPFLEDFEKPRAASAPIDALPPTSELIEEAETLEGKAFEDIEPGPMPPAEEPIDLSKMTKAELVAHAESVGVDSVPDSMTKKNIIALIEGK